MYVCMYVCMYVGVIKKIKKWYGIVKNMSGLPCTT